MNKQEALQYLSSMRDDLRNSQKFPGQAKLVRDIGKDLQWMSTRVLTGNEPRLFIKKWDDILEAIKSK